MRDYIIIRHESFQARILLSELHLLDVLHFRRLIKLAEHDPWQNGPELDMLREALPELIDSAMAEAEEAKRAARLPQEASWKKLWAACGKGARGAEEKG